jgi:thiamine biosynthesis lipoprotein
MGSPLRFTGVGRGSAAAWAEVCAEFAAADVALSRFRDDSELIALDRSAGMGLAVPVGRRLERAVITAERARRSTGGRFEPRIVGDLQRIGERGPIPLSVMTTGPGQRAWAGRPIVRRPARGLLIVDDPLDLGGIGKGLALRWSAARVEQTGMREFLLDAGGDIVVRGQPPEGDRWRVGIEDPTDPAAAIAVVEVSDLAIATSSIIRGRWRAAGEMVHHLIDPASGRPSWAGLLAVTVAARDPAWAEVWSKALFLDGSASIAEEARGRGMAAWWIDDDGRLSMTPAARALTTWVAGEH